MSHMPHDDCANGMFHLKAVLFDLFKTLITEKRPSYCVKSR